MVFHGQLVTSEVGSVEGDIGRDFCVIIASEALYGRYWQFWMGLISKALTWFHGGVVHVNSYVVDLCKS